jgi:hypothetical protein
VTRLGEPSDSCNAPGISLSVVPAKRLQPVDHRRTALLVLEGKTSVRGNQALSYL